MFFFVQRSLECVCVCSRAWVRREDGAWAQRCLGEYNILRLDSGSANGDEVLAVVFNGLDDDVLRWAGTFVEPFEPARLGWCPASGRLYHALDGRLGPWGLLGSHVAHQLSASLEVDGDDVRLRWRGDVYAVPCVEFRESP